MLTGGPGPADGAGGAASGNDLLAFLNDFRAARYEPLPTPGAEIDLTTGAAGGAAVAGGAGVAGAGGAGDPYGDPYSDPYSDPYEGRIAPGGPGWWQASDHKWYPPELHPDYQAEPAPAAAPTSAADMPAAAGPAASATAAPASPAGAAWPAPDAAATQTADDGGSGKGRLRLGRLGRR